MQRSTSWINNTFMRQFKSYFGTDWFYCSLLWELSWKPVYNLPNIARPEHLLWALMHMKLYLTENVLTLLANCDKKCSGSCQKFSEKYSQTSWRKRWVQGWLLFIEYVTNTLHYILFRFFLRIKKLAQKRAIFVSSLLMEQIFELRSNILFGQDGSHINSRVQDFAMKSELV